MIAGTTKYEEIVGPVIEEHEKTISMMEAELKLNRTALTHTSDLYNEKDTETVPQGTEVQSCELTEKEASTMSYIRVLEENVKCYGENSIFSSGSMTELKRELFKFQGHQMSCFSLYCGTGGSSDML
ncbi:hypothetical protein A0H81_05424 [Grifola frondosa]|uniref:Uncharacterized protein n=1 Tax=Grifola frondosa TaxID=5627 RepID=A0A1C7MCA8_GRIFR|nr:hypothetical protein A0H81_05424 [Grifola frondosa]